MYLIGITILGLVVTAIVSFVILNLGLTISVWWLVAIAALGWLIWDEVIKKRKKK